jgi:poly-gamma-glutamate biosynthesis protein PgsC/CapC
MIELAIGLGMALNLVLTEAFGLASAGLVVPGYLALYLDQPWRVAATWAVALATWALVRFGWARLIVLYGRRRFGVTVLSGFVLNVLVTQALPYAPPVASDIRVIGHIVPGLIANTALAQGVWPTVAATFLVAGAVRILLSLAGW